ncbi:hypothetical protein ASPCAL08810 [Aspergillus calidoustus]|uniref:Reverse transcriptase domain-containing protein n=1 Tax=Aspergillus calidoustus TaxID=454130 RepID=A0A0U5GVB0_ASPCI|nr:hypothetical protein ASPCAL08810 [Aspergillus calidoustus]
MHDPNAYYAFNAEEDPDQGAVQDIATFAMVKPKNQERLQFNGKGPTTKLSNGVSVYGGPEVVRRLQRVVETFPSIWTSKELVNIPISQWMRIRLKPGWEDQVKQEARRYSLAKPDEKAVDRVFNGLHEHNYMGWTDTLTPSGSPVFVAKKVVDPKLDHEYQGKYQSAIDLFGLDKANDLLPENKGVKTRVVVDLRRKNAMAIPDVYLLPTQQDILSAVAGCLYLSVADATAMFYQWPVHPDSYQHTGVVSHRGQEFFKVCIMGFLNSVPHVQRHVDNYFRAMRKFLRAYIDDLSALVTLWMTMSSTSISFSRSARN